MTIKLHKSTSRKGFALPMTIIAVAGLTLLLVGLLTVLTLERKTARSYSDAARADLAVESGLATALGTLTEIAERDDSIVFRLEDPVQPTVPVPAPTAGDPPERPLGFREQFFTYGAIYQNNAWRGIPLFSGAPETALGATRIDTAPLVSSLATYTADAVAISRQTEHDQNIPRAQWVEIPATDTNDYTIRYSYWIEDLSGRIDGKNAGAIDRAEGESAAELDYATIFSPEMENPVLPPLLVSARNKLRSSASIRQFFNGTASPETPDEGKRLEPYIQFYPSAQTVTPSHVIPQGFGYTDAGKTPSEIKTELGIDSDLNNLVDRAALSTSDSEAAVDEIAELIGRNLPQFENRKGGFPSSEDYLKTLAASMIDYADTDDIPTLGTGYRGVDSYPFVNELFDRYEWTDGTSNSVKIKVETYAELWNPSNQELTGTAFFVNENRHEISVPPNGSQNFTNSGTYIAKFRESPSANEYKAIPPNGFAVVSLGSKEYSFPASATFPPSELIFTETTDSNFTLRWNGKIVDRARGGLQRTNGNLRNGTGARKWKGNSSPALDYSIGQVGDPRASYYINTWVYANNYNENSNWGGRCLKRSISNSNYNEVRIPDWADSGTNSTEGVKTVNDSRYPGVDYILNSNKTKYAGSDYPANEEEKAPAFISNEGRYTSIAELGNIFDPAQIENVNSATLVGSQNAGGGFTLAIGRPEFGAFDKEGQRSAQLLDLLSIRPVVSASTEIGRPVNINTAPREVLRTLIAGVTLDADLATSAVTVPKDTQIGDIFADFVLAQRAAYPLRGPSDLNNIRKNPATTRNPATPADSPFFGSRDAYAEGTSPPETWNDAGREELFRKTLNLVTYSSKTFRIVVAGEALDKAGKVIGRATREYHYSIEPERDTTTGDILKDSEGKPVRIIITKHYEKSL